MHDSTLGALPAGRSLFAWRALRVLVVLVGLAGCAPRPALGPRALADRFAARTGFQGVVLVARHDSVLLAAPVGLADLEAGVPAALDTRYQIGSIAKWVASIVVLGLVDDGALSLTEPLGAYLPGLPEATAWRVTLHHLLSNTSGVPDGVVAAYEADPTALDAPLSTDEAVRRFASGDLQFEPGAQFDYALANWVLVQAVIERVTGQPFDAVLRDRLTEPLGMENTGAFSTETLPRLGVAPGYTEVDPEPVRVQLPDPAYLAAAGGVYSTAPDLLRLLHALYGGSVLSDASLQRLGLEGYAYGGHLARLRLGGSAEPALWLTGSNGPSKARVSRVLSTGLSVITLTNVGVSPEETGALTEAVLEALAR